MQKHTVLSVIGDVNGARKKGTGQFVGAVYDKSSPVGDFPAALVVGINYGQIGTSSSVVGHVEDDIRYFRHVAALLKKEGLPSDCHVVVWNFFPYLTAAEWLEEIANSDDEAERIFDQGYIDPMGVFEDLVTKLSILDYYVVFHGISSAVPTLARIAIRKVGKKCFLVPNLSRGLVIRRAKKIA